MEQERETLASDVKAGDTGLSVAATLARYELTRRAG
jgi:hypothetical protein